MVVGRPSVRRVFFFPFQSLIRNIIHQNVCPVAFLWVLIGMHCVLIILQFRFLFHNSECVFLCRVSSVLPSRCFPHCSLVLCILVYYLHSYGPLRSHLVFPTRTLWVDQADLELAMLTVFVSWRLGLQACATRPCFLFLCCTEELCWLMPCLGIIDCTSKPLSPPGTVLRSPLFECLSLEP